MIPTTKGLQHLEIQESIASIKNSVPINGVVIDDNCNIDDNLLSTCSVSVS